MFRGALGVYIAYIHVYRMYIGVNMVMKSIRKGYKRVYTHDRFDVQGPGGGRTGRIVAVVKAGERVQEFSEVGGAALLGAGADVRLEVESDGGVDTAAVVVGDLRRAAGGGAGWGGETGGGDGRDGLGGGGGGREGSERGVL